jgi:hypothetical protein
MPEYRRATWREDPVTAALLERLSHKLGITKVGALRLAVRRLAELEGIPIPEELEGKAAA